MTLKDAIKHAGPNGQIRRDGVTLTLENGEFAGTDSGGDVTTLAYFTVQDILANDWEYQEQVWRGSAKRKRIHEEDEE